MRRFFDTNILVYAYDARHPAKREIARSLLEDAVGSGSLVVSSQVLVEFYASCVRKNILSGSQALALLRLWSEHDAVAQTPELVLRGIELHQKHSLSQWDGLIVQAALDARCDVLLSEDLQHGRRFGELEVVNPFHESAALHEPRRRAYGGRRKR